MNILQRLKDGAGKVTDRAQNVVEIGKLNTQISNIERELGLYFQKMGEVFYEAYRKKDMATAEKEMLELAKTCDLLTEERDEIRLKIAELKNERLCGACGRNVAEDALFCQYCGHKLVKAKPSVPAELLKAAPEPVQPPVVSEAAVSSEPPVMESMAVGEMDTLVLAASLVREKTEPREPEQVSEPVEPVGPEDEERRQRELERERKRQEELDRRIRSWSQNAAAPQTENSEVEVVIGGVTTVKCQICSSTLVKGTKWCPHCGSEQI
ncbi:zinc ribbon domain-containing protein [Paenibacillus sp. DXFW5]|uniref:Zinc ribbon domain-containing protein n=1 Tax=Paenibacillus rhizolycopersici TaxID=2780073 RepID=A0ABS2HA19_9BACL|nr:MULTISPECIES: zinc ribbon domain-containing protein [Paenibacillus]MBM6997636.1 zinc ribbon domain-containing protein [Paenibacillus rhizolycopersici]MUG87604.1 zinc ribbon domain-containing protein [Paenibacillus timonensis]